tara:strand:- start:23259 stop:23717 length:459 start_codon:yes stop_codon:yes gene_type:complete
MLRYLQILPKREFEALLLDEEQYLELQETTELLEHEHSITMKRIAELESGRYSQPEELTEATKVRVDIRAKRERLEKLEKELIRLENRGKTAKLQLEARRKKELHNLKKQLPKMARRMMISQGRLGRYLASAYRDMVKIKKKEILNGKESNS